MEQNKFRSYFFYAVGEIALVMIGILLALQVNNWNEEKKQDQASEALLTAIQKDILTDIKLLDEAMASHEERFDALKVMLSDTIEVADYDGSKGIELYRWSSTYFPIILSKDNYQYFINQVDKESEKYTPVIELLNQLYKQHGKELEYFRDTYLKHLQEYKKLKRDNYSWYSQPYSNNEMPNDMKEFYATDPINRNFLNDGGNYIANLYFNLKLFKDTGISAYKMIHELASQQPNSLPEMIEGYEIDLSKEEKMKWVGTYLPQKNQLNKDAFGAQADSILIEVNESGMLSYKIFFSDVYSEMEDTPLKARTSSHFFNYFSNYYFSNDTLTLELNLSEPSIFIKK